MSITVGLIAKKVAVALLSDKRTWKVIGSSVVVISLILLAPVIILMSLFGGVGNAITLDSNQIISGLPTEYQTQIVQVDVALVAITKEISKQQVDVNPIKAHIIYTYVLMGYEQGNQSFYQEYVSCFLDSKNDNVLFDNIQSKFKIKILDNERTQIIEYYNKIVTKKQEESS